MPVDLLPEVSTEFVKLQDGSEVEICFRAFTLRDLAWMQKEFSTKEQRDELTALKLEAMAKICWYMMESESKAKFPKVFYMDFDEETGEQNKVQIIGHQKLMHCLASQADLMKLFVAYCTIKSVNDFVPDVNKKKA